MAKTKEKKQDNKSRFDTTIGVAHKIYNAIKKKAIDMGEPADISTEELEGKKWTSKALETGAIISFEYTKKKKGDNSRSILRIHRDDKVQSMSGEWARKTFLALTKETKRKTVKLDEESQLFCQDALKGL